MTEENSRPIHPSLSGLRMKDPLDRAVARNLAKQVLTRIEPDDPEAAMWLEFSDRLMDAAKEPE